MMYFGFGWFATVFISLILDIFKVNHELVSKWYDLWIGVYIQEDKTSLYIFLIPTFGLKISLRKPS